MRRKSGCMTDKDQKEPNKEEKELSAEEKLNMAIEEKKALIDKTKGERLGAFLMAIMFAAGGTGLYYMSGPMSSGKDDDTLRQEFANSAILDQITMETLDNIGIEMFDAVDNKTNEIRRDISSHFGNVSAVDMDRVDQIIADKIETYKETKEFLGNLFKGISAFYGLFGLSLLGVSAAKGHEIRKLKKQPSPENN
jgi:hypothetical protein